MGDLKKPKKKRTRKQFRIFVEWICGRCHNLHRISFICSFKAFHTRGRGLKIRAKWQKAMLRKVEIEPETTLSEMNGFLNSLFHSEFDAEKYVKICYSRKLIMSLTKNERKLGSSVN